MLGDTPCFGAQSNTEFATLGGGDTTSPKKKSSLKKYNNNNGGGMMRIGSSSAKKQRNSRGRCSLGRSLLSLHASPIQPVINNNNSSNSNDKTYNSHNKKHSFSSTWETFGSSRKPSPTDEMDLFDDNAHYGPSQGQHLQYLECSIKLFLC